MLGLQGDTQLRHAGHAPPVVRDIGVVRAISSIADPCIVAVFAWNGRSRDSGSGVTSALHQCIHPGMNGHVDSRIEDY